METLLDYGMYSTEYLSILSVSYQQIHCHSPLSHTPPKPISWIEYSVSEFIDPWLGEKVNAGIGTPDYMAGGPAGYDNPMPGLTLSPSQWSMNSATERLSENFDNFPGRLAFV